MSRRVLGVWGKVCDGNRLNSDLFSFKVIRVKTLKNLCDIECGTRGLEDSSLRRQDPSETSGCRVLTSAPSSYSTVSVSLSFINLRYHASRLKGVWAEPVSWWWVGKVKCLCVLSHQISDVCFFTFSKFCVKLKTKVNMNRPISFR